MFNLETGVRTYFASGLLVHNCHFAYTHTRGPLAGKRERPSGSESGGDLMPTEMALRLVRELAAYGVRSITWPGGGEPTLHPDFDAVMRAGHLAGLDQGVYTNGAHLNAFRASILRTYTTWTYISLDECTAEAYQRSKGVNAFERVCAGTRLLSAADGPATVGVGFLLHQRNWMQAEQMIALGRDLGAQYIQFRPTILYDQERPGRRAENVAWMDAMLALLRTIHEPDVICDVPRFEQYQQWNGHQYRMCWYSALATVITPNGKVWRCVNKRERSGALIGDVSTEPFAAIWERAGPSPVDGDCRLMCCGHAANTVLAEIMPEVPHANFI